MKLIKSFFIAILIISATTCFADPEDDEFTELKLKILDPIVHNFKKGVGSPSERLRRAILAIEEDEGRQFTKNEICDMVRCGDFDDAVDDDSFNKCIAVVGQLGSAIDAGVYAEQYLKLWENKTANCGIYANLVLWAFEFNRVNTIAQGKESRFEMATLAITRPGTGQHVIVLVQGKSGAVFAIDPWIRKVIPFNKVIPSKNFTTKLSTGMRNIALPDSDRIILNFIYSQPYYDAYYVDAGTVWVIQIDRSKKMVEMLHMYDSNMEKFYNTLKNSGFPWWEKSYIEFFPSQ